MLIVLIDINYLLQRFLASAIVISHSTEEQSSRTAAVQAVSDVIKHIWPQCKASEFSCAW